MLFLIPGKHPEDMINFLSRITLLVILQKKPKQLFSSQHAEWMWVYFLRPIPILAESATAKFWNKKEFHQTATWLQWMLRTHVAFWSFVEHSHEEMLSKCSFVYISQNSASVSDFYPGLSLTLDWSHKEGISRATLRLSVT